MSRRVTLQNQLFVYLTHSNRSDNSIRVLFFSMNYSSTINLSFLLFFLPIFWFFYYWTKSSGSLDRNNQPVLHFHAIKTIGNQPSILNRQGPNTLRQSLEVKKTWKKGSMKTNQMVDSKKKRKSELGVVFSRLCLPSSQCHKVRRYNCDTCPCYL